MYQFYNNAPSPHYLPQLSSGATYPSPAPPGVMQYDPSSLTSDEMVKKRYQESDTKLRHALSRVHFPTSENRQQCSAILNRLRLHRNLFMHAFVHIASCCRGRYLHQLVDDANHWTAWSSVKQLVHHSLIRERLVFFLGKSSCHEHETMRDQRFETRDDESDLLCLLLYCGKKQEMYKLSYNDVEQVIELLWQFLMKSQEISDLRRLRAFIYRLARKSAYLPHALQISHTSISNRRNLGVGASGMVTMAKMNRRDVVIKTIVCSDPTARQRCLEMFASEAILWRTLQHKNIVPFLGVVMEDTFNMGLVSPFFKYGNVRECLQRYPHQEWPRWARKWARDLAEGLAYIHCHEPPIIHGDLKGDNVLVDDSGSACLGDFGQSYASDSGKYLDSTRVGLAASPVNWMAPELIDGGDQDKVSDKSDIYSFGCVLYEMVSGQIPFQGLEFGDVVQYVRKGGRPMRPRSVLENDPLWRTITLCWQSRPGTRPSAMRLISSLH